MLKKTMKLKSIVIILTCLTILSFTKQDETKWISIKWVDNIENDFSFKEEWSYPEGVYKNKFGQLSCDGICPPEIDRMKNEEGKIYPDSLKAFYAIVDTTHLFHSITSEAWTYEWAGTDFMTFKKQADNSILGQSACKVSTHSSLIIEIKNDSFRAWIDFNSITELGKQIFPMKEGQIRVDKKLFDKGIIKAEFDLKFVNTLDVEREMYWKGLIYSKIEK
ncbi:hypothetical protein OO013_18265 [Mangrovivirga sp. M17]|uniref:Uncharacterized protein n=1 Tax=Mangrovivirga halotolerans TaxID=2993936 RepID=A0ABT3RW21_9BACT|nr:hypothetical protein [Mangrovivirga halotolerans]MCX2745833.1 hypothetical protein [Mangrovivirga halotolerans]